MGTSLKFSLRLYILWCISFLKVGSTPSVEPNVGLEIRRLRVRCLTYQATQAPLCCIFLNSLARFKYSNVKIPKQSYCSKKKTCLSWEVIFPLTSQHKDYLVSHMLPLPVVLVSCEFYNKSPKTWCFRTTEIYSVWF